MTRHADLDVCPRSECNHPIIDSFVTRDPFQIKHVNAVQYKTCVVPEVDDSGPYVYVVFHDEPDTEFTPASDLDEGTDEGEEPEEVVEAEPEPEPAADLSALTQFEEQIYVFVDKQDGSAMLAEIAGHMVGAKDRQAVDAAVERLVDEGYLDEIENGVYKTAA